MYKIIRAGTGFDPVVAISPAEANLGDRGASYYRFRIPGGNFDQITEEAALYSFSGQADGWGYEAPPDQVFPTLDAVKDFAREKFDEFWKKQE